MSLMLVNRSWFGFENHFILPVYHLFLDIHLSACKSAKITRRIWIKLGIVEFY
jgi:hypothetical protein